MGDMVAELFEDDAPRTVANFVALAISMSVILVLLVGGLVFFKRMERSFADVI